MSRRDSRIGLRVSAHLLARADQLTERMRSGEFDEYLHFSDPTRADALRLALQEGLKAIEERDQNRTARPGRFSRRADGAA